MASDPNRREAPAPRTRQREAPAPPPVDPSWMPPRPRRRQQMNGTNLLVIGVVAFIFGVALHVYVVKSVLDSGGSNNNGGPSAGQPVVVSTATSVPGVAAATVTPTVAAALPDRTSCDEIRGTDYRSPAEREFFLANCILPTPTPAPATPTPSATKPPAAPTPTPKP